jgi:ABC-type spermidine/putrescine transport system permease subunit I
MPFVLLAIPFIYLAVLFFAPLVISLFYSVGMVDRLFRIVPTFTPNYYIASIDFTFLYIFGRSLLIAGLTAVVCFLLGYPVAYTIGLKMRRLRSALMILVILPYWVSFLLRIYALMTILRYLDTSFLNKLGIPLMGTIWAVLLGMFYDYVPFMILPLYASIEKLDVSVLEASKTLGANPIRTFIHVTLPMTAPGITAGAVLVFVPSVGEFLVPYFLGGANTYMLGNLIIEMFLKTQNWWFGSAISTVMLTLVLVIVLVYMKYGGGEIAF